MCTPLFLYFTEIKTAIIIYTLYNRHHHKMYLLNTAIVIIKSILAPYVRKEASFRETDLNRPEMNCSMSIPPHFYFSNNILYDFPSSSSLIFLVVDLVLTWEVLKGVVSFCKMRWRGTIRYNVTVMRIGTVIGGKARYHYRR